MGSTITAWAAALGAREHSTAAASKDAATTAAGVARRGLEVAAMDFEAPLKSLATLCGPVATESEGRAGLPAAVRGEAHAVLRAKRE